MSSSILSWQSNILLILLEVRVISRAVLHLNFEYQHISALFFLPLTHCFVFRWCPIALKLASSRRRPVCTEHTEASHKPRPRVSSSARPRRLTRHLSLTTPTFTVWGSVSKTPDLEQCSWLSVPAASNSTRYLQYYILYSQCSNRACCCTQWVSMRLYGTLSVIGSVGGRDNLHRILDAWKFVLWYRISLTFKSNASRLTGVVQCRTNRFLQFERFSSELPNTKKFHIK